MIHNVDVHRNEYLPLVVINLASEDVSLSKGETIGYMSVQPLEISEILMETAIEPPSLICDIKEEKCHELFELLKASLMTEPILKYPDPDLPYMLFIDASRKYAWACVLTQEKIHHIEGKETKILHPITYMSGLFRRSQLNWACLIKEAYAIYMSIKKLAYYLEDADITLRSDHLPLKKFLAKNTLNSKVNNWLLRFHLFVLPLNILRESKIL